MADFSDKMKKAWLKGMEAIGNTAGNIASNTRYKVNEMTLLNRRREILSDFGARAYDLWQKGEVFPEELARQLEELSQVDIQLNALRMERLAGVKAAEEQEATPETGEPCATAEEETPAEAAPAQEDSDVQPGTSPLMDKANQALDTIGSTLKNVGNILGGAINSVTDTLTGKKTVPADEATSSDVAHPDVVEPETAESETTPPPETENSTDSPEENAEESKSDAPASTAEDNSENPDEYKVE